MRRAIEQALASAAMGEVPVGAVIVCEDRIVAEAGNRREIDNDPLAHAENLAIAKASQTLERWRLSGCTLYVTLEPCVMCAGSIINSRIDRVVYGTPDLRYGAVESIYRILADARLNHRPEVLSGVLKEECAIPLREFFKSLRGKRS